MKKDYLEGFEEAIRFVFTKTGANQPAKEIVELMRKRLKRLKKEAYGPGVGCD